MFDDADAEAKVEAAPERLLLIDVPTNAPDDIRAMEHFVAGLSAGEARRDLERVLRRAKPFRNFREALRDWPDVRGQWFALDDQRKEAAVRAWLAG